MSLRVPVEPCAAQRRPQAASEQGLRISQDAFGVAQGGFGGCTSSLGLSDRGFLITGVELHQHIATADVLALADLDRAGIGR